MSSSPCIVQWSAQRQTSARGCRESRRLFGVRIIVFLGEHHSLSLNPSGGGSFRIANDYAVFRRMVFEKRAVGKGAGGRSSLLRREKGGARGNCERRFLLKDTFLRSSFWGENSRAGGDSAGAGKTGNEGINRLLLTTPVARPGSWFL